MRKALIAMSGGVDSSVAAYLVKSQGYECAGVTMRLFLNGDIGLASHYPCCSQKDADDAASVAAILGISHEVADCMVDFKLCVIDKFIQVYRAGGTPNPCIDCNRYLKFDGLLKAARARGMDAIATGHYARVERDKNSGRYLLNRALDLSRDQSYVLYTLTQEQLAHTLFPLGSLNKTEVRALAASLGFLNAQKHDSQDICFVPDGDYARFIEQYTGEKSRPGNFIDPKGTVLGRHKGIIHYTIGQRKGLGIAWKTPLYVSAMDPAANTVTLSEEKDLFFRAVTAMDINLISVPSLEGPVRAGVKIRYRQKEAPATVTQTGRDELLIEFDEPQRAPAVGQAAVLYDGDTVIGGGTISGAIK